VTPQGPYLQGPCGMFTPPQGTGTDRFTNAQGAWVGLPSSAGLCDTRLAEGGVTPDTLV